MAAARSFLAEAEMRVNQTPCRLMTPIHRRRWPNAASCRQPGGVGVGVREGRSGT